MILLIDNYDSFVHNLGRYCQRLGCEVAYARNDTVSVGEIRAMAPSVIILSPGPRTPAEAGVSIDVVRKLGGDIPILGVCLGHQAIAAAFGGQIIRAPRPVHGRTSPIRHDGKQEFAGLPVPFIACRYHSLIVDPATLPAVLEISARTDGEIIMGLRHREFPIVGWQFHPEAIQTEYGYRVLGQFLNSVGIQTAGEIQAIKSEAPIVREFELPDRPVTF